MADSSTGRAKWAALAVEIPAVVVLMVMAVHVVANALMRRFFREPIANTLELVQYWYLPILALLGIVAAQVRGQHIAADLIYTRFPEVGKRIYAIAGLAVCIAVSVGFTWFGLLEALDSMEIGRTAGVTGLPIWPVYFFVPAVFATLAVQLAISLLKGRSFEAVEDTDAVFDEELEKELKS